MPVPLAGPVAGRQGDKIDPKIAKACGIAQGFFGAVPGAFMEGRGLAGAFAGPDGGDVNLGHLFPPKEKPPEA